MHKKQKLSKSQLLVTNLSSNTSVTCICKLNLLRNRFHKLFFLLLCFIHLLVNSYVDQIVKTYLTISSIIRMCRTKNPLFLRIITNLQLSICISMNLLLCETSHQFYGKYYIIRMYTTNPFKSTSALLFCRAD